MENDLIMNHIPLPKYYDGVQWNTVVKPTRKYIPKYLHEDLPQLRHMYIKQIFKQMGKFNVPNLEFFNNMIKNKHKKNNQKRSSSVINGKAKNLSYNEVKQELQYALMLTDRNSNVMDQLVHKAQKVQESKRGGNNSSNFISTKDGGKSFRSRSVNKNSFIKQNSGGKYFDHTVDLVFRNRRNTYLQSLKKPKEIDEIPERFQKRFQELGLIDINNSHL